MLLRDRKVLIVDDNASNRQILSVQLEKWGVEATVVTSGIKAISSINQDAPGYGASEERRGVSHLK